MTRTAYKLDATRTFGIELEAFGVERHIVCDALNAAGIVCVVEGYNHSTRSYWKIVNDGSIQGEHSFELVSPPLAGSEGVKQVETVCKVLHSLGVKVNKSCGTHVHHGAGDLTLAQWQSLCKYFLRYEETMDTIMPKSRRADKELGWRETDYCKAVRRRFADLHDAFTKIASATTLHELADIFCGNDRYHTLNMTAFWRHGTVEFRQHSGTIDAEKILHWVSLTQCLIVRAMRKPTPRTTGTTLESLCNKVRVSAVTTQYYANRQKAFAGR